MQYGERSAVIGVGAATTEREAGTTLSFWRKVGEDINMCIRKRLH